MILFLSFYVILSLKVWNDSKTRNNLSLKNQSSTIFHCDFYNEHVGISINTFVSSRKLNICTKIFPSPSLNSRVHWTSCLIIYFIIGLSIFNFLHQNKHWLGSICHFYGAKVWSYVQNVLIIRRKGAVKIKYNLLWPLIDVFYTCFCNKWL